MSEVNRIPNNVDRVTSLSSQGRTKDEKSARRRRKDKDKGKSREKAKFEVEEADDDAVVSEANEDTEALPEDEDRGHHIDVKA